MGAAAEHWGVGDEGVMEGGRGEGMEEERERQNAHKVNKNSSCLSSKHMLP